MNSGYRSGLALAGFGASHGAEGAKVELSRARHTTGHHLAAGT